jgi:endonuclease V-like protein UPF0215 family
MTRHVISNVIGFDDFPRPHRGDVRAVGVVYSGALGRRPSRRSTFLASGS